MEAMSYNVERFRRVLHRITAMRPSRLRKLRACWLAMEAMSVKSEVLSSIASVLLTIAFIDVAARSTLRGPGYELVRHIDDLWDLLLIAAIYMRFFE